MRVIDRILGSRLDEALAVRLHHLEHHDGVDFFTLQSADLGRRRLRATTGKGEEIALALPREQPLFDGAVLALERDYALIVRVAEQRWLRLVPQDKASAVELGYHAGNLHWRVQFEGDALLVALEAPIEDYLVRLAGLVASGRVQSSVKAPEVTSC
ncbi:urease accessory protein UreE [Methylocella silvestris]|uniref:Urease accessory protein UreE n=1 Tax=Methylocella silvestris TaxID=199596 RepID=A0A2J7TDS5_METSI|nr:urease accessory protein UreE [Methylocella silvestris]PNG24883.1 urease accessory protein UreE [Methylocella silvestris]